MSRSIKLPSVSDYPGPNFTLLGLKYQVTLVGIDLSDVSSDESQTSSGDVHESLKVKHCGR